MARSKSKTARTSRNKEPDPPPTPDEIIIDRLTAWRIELSGGLLFLLSLILLVTLPFPPAENFISSLANMLRQIFGWSAYLLLLGTGFSGLHIALRRFEKPYTIHTNHVVGGLLLLLTILPVTFHLLGTTLAEARLGRGGGLIGWGLSVPLLEFLGPILTYLIYLIMFGWGLSLLTGIGFDDLLNALDAATDWLQKWAEAIAPQEKPVEDEPVATMIPPQPLVPPPEMKTAVSPPTASTPKTTRLSKPRRSKKLPSIALLDDIRFQPLSDDEIDAKSKLIVKALKDFGIPADVTEVRRGPAVTQYGVEPGYVERTGPDGQPKKQKIRVSQIARLQRDLTLALSAPRIRIQAPVPGRSVVGIEVPNDDTSVVRMRPVIEAAVFQRLRSPLAVALGRDVSGDPVALDLAKMPHLLIAGTTGSGKSVCMNALVSCLIFNNSPDTLKLVMIDPKKVEYIRFNSLPHLIGNVEVEADRAVGVLRWLTAEMDRRYESFSRIGARNLNGYNRKAGKGEHKAYPILPHMVVFIDELADLIITYPGDVEQNLCRLAQMARATGIHLVVATQRPSTDVITGLIKANFPARISFAVASGTDSRVILDSVGAENLLGKGDMLYLPPDEGSPARVQGVYVTDPEIERIVDFWNSQGDTYEKTAAPWEPLIAKHALLDETDTLLEAAVELAKKYDTISSSLLQRRLRIGFPRAARLMEHLFEMGLVEDPKEGGKTRRTFVDDENDPFSDLP